VVEYTYDAWGKPTGKTGTMAGTLGTVQPFRYRGYVWDEETGLYYLRSRYYSPTHNRFLNADRLFTQHTYAYCNNNPISYIDSKGTEFFYNPYEYTYFIMKSHDYRKTISDGLEDLGCNIENYDEKTDLEIYDYLVSGVASTMAYNQKTGLMTIPNDSTWMKLLQEIVIYSSDYSRSGYYYANDVAVACKKVYREKTGEEYQIAEDKIALEIRLHYNTYTMLKAIGIDEKHSRDTDISPYEGNIFQKVIDLLYDWGVK
ncbi:MAG: RHS repeat-associated core domain-containing protein, partial [Clostridia bacterium]|nr:RHS repeat-associated core domain-containing protein [Clostridia bacterium]